MIITIDGPAGTGKSTVAKGVAKKLGFAFFDTGATYRSLAWLALKKKVNPADEKAVVALLAQFHYEIRLEEAERRYFVNDVEVTAQIRTPEVSVASSQVAIYPEVRKAMVKIQRAYGSLGNVVFEGRDMGTVVFPEADLKIFLTAKPAIRAERRYQELMQKTPHLNLNKEALLKEIEERDIADSTRKLSPLKQAKDAILIDTSHLTAEEVIERVIELYRK
jgi:CMP/dCMP kinase